MKALKIGIGVVLAVVVVLAVGLWLLADNLDGIVAAAIERYGSEITGTAVSVGAVSIDLGAGRATITDLRVANPDGFSDRDAFSLQEITVQIDPGSVRSEPYRLPQIRVAAPQVLYEVNQEAARNLDVIRGNVEAYVAQQGGGGPASGESGAGDAASGPAPRMIIDRLEFTGGRVQADASALGVDPRAVDLPGFQLADLGAPDGAPADAIARQALARLARQAAESVARSEVQDLLRDQLEGDLGDQLPDAVQEKAGQLLDRIGG